MSCGRSGLAHFAAPGPLSVTASRPRARGFMGARVPGAYVSALARDWVLAPIRFPKCAHDIVHDIVSAPGPVPIQKKWLSGDRRCRTAQLILKLVLSLPTGHRGTLYVLGFDLE